MPISVFTIAFEHGIFGGFQLHDYTGEPLSEGIVDVSSHSIPFGQHSGVPTLLADFGQPVAKLRFADGAWSGLFRHVLKVFLLDGRSQVRNVYSVGLLDATLVLTDLRTLLLESAAHGRKG